MKKMLVVIGVLALFSVGAIAQSHPAKTSVEAAGQNGVTHQNGAHANGVPAACNPCVWYSGDLDSSNPYADGLFNANATYYGIEGQVWVPMVIGSDGDPTHGHVRINSVTFNEQFADILACGACDYTGSTYDMRVKVGSGEAGTVKESGTCPQSPAPVPTGNALGAYAEYSFTCLSSTKPHSYFLEVAVGSVYWINVTPTFTGGDYAYLSDVEDVPSRNQLGWSDDFYNSFFYSGYFGYNFSPTQTTAAGSPCGGVGCDMLSVAVGGTYVK
jgi:hypothetical protein